MLILSWRYYNIKKFTIVFCLVCGFLACGNQTNEPKDKVTVNLSSGLEKKNKHYLSEIANDIEFIKLETSPECRISKVYGINKLKDDLVIINGNARREFGGYSSILIFNTEGKFIRKIGRQGKGPNEYTDIIDVCVDAENENIFVLSSSKEILQYSINGDLIRKTKIPFITSHFTIFHGKLLFHFNSVTNWQNDGFLFLLTNYDFTDHRKYVKGLTNPGAFLANKIYKYGEGYRYWSNMQNDTVYNIDNNFKMIPVYNFEFPNKPTQNAFLDFTKFSPSYSMINRFTETNNYIFIEIAFNEKLERVVFIKDQGISIGFDSYSGFINDLSGGVRFFPTGKIMNEELFICYDIIDIKPYWEMNYKDNGVIQYSGTIVKKERRAIELDKLLDNSNEEDNPIIAVIRL